MSFVGDGSEDLHHYHDSAFDPVGHGPEENENFKVVVRLRPPVPRELHGERPFVEVVKVQRRPEEEFGKVVIISEHLEGEEGSRGILNSQVLVVFVVILLFFETPFTPKKVFVIYFYRRPTPPKKCMRLTPKKTNVRDSRLFPHSTYVFLSQTLTFDTVYDQHSTQKTLYENTAKQAVLSVLQGYNATMIAYGQTGTGKTYTMEVLCCSVLRCAVPC